MYSLRKYPVIIGEIRY